MILPPRGQISNIEICPIICDSRDLGPPDLDPERIEDPPPPPFPLPAQPPFRVTGKGPEEPLEGRRKKDPRVAEASGTPK